MKRHRLYNSCEGRRQDWRNYQDDLRNGDFLKRQWRQALRCLLALTVISGCIYGVQDISTEDPSQQSEPYSKTGAFPSLSALMGSYPRQRSGAAPDSRHAAPGRNSGILHKEDLCQVMPAQAFVNPKAGRIPIAVNGRDIMVQTSINDDLQNFLLSEMDRDHARHIAIVVMEPETGRIIAMGGHDSQNPQNNPCLDSQFPAASIFKIVTAAAAIQELGLGPYSTLNYSGARHTLYKSQLASSPKRPTHSITLKDSFAQSVNPVFGKLGQHQLKKHGLIEYAQAFGFNRSICFDLPMDESHIQLSDDPYHWAEIASGFNRTTTLSPVHAAMIVGAISANGGRLVEPAIVDRITDSGRHVLYKNHPAPLPSAVSQESASLLKNIMTETIKTGTCRKTFKGADSHPVLSRLTIGGKTGSINSHTQEHIRYDWFVGFAEDPAKKEQIVIASVVAHHRYIGKRATQYARLIMEHYFDRFFNSQPSPRRADTAPAGMKAKDKPYAGI